MYVVVCTLCALQDKLTPLMWAAVGGHIDVVQVLLDINKRDKVVHLNGNGHLLSHMSLQWIKYSTSHLVPPINV